jgi:hypothetical protein
MIRQCDGCGSDFHEHELERVYYASGRTLCPRCEPDPDTDGEHCQVSFVGGPPPIAPEVWERLSPGARDALLHLAFPEGWR